jgi:hypothetical protein
MSVPAILLTLLLQQVSSFADFTRLSGDTAKARYDNAVAEGRRGSGDTFWVAYQMPGRGNVRVNTSDGIEIVQKNNSDPAAVFLLVGKADGAVSKLRVVGLGEDIRVYDRRVYWLGELNSDENGALLLNIAKSSASTQVKRDAVFWLGQEISRQAGEDLEKLATSDPEVEVQKQVVFALSQRRNDESIASLQRIARDHPNAAVRKQAIFWLGQKRDPRVLEFFEQLLKK